MDQLKYSLRSIETYVPWIRHIYIVTNGQGKNKIIERVTGAGSSLREHRAALLGLVITDEFFRLLLVQKF